MKPVEHLKVNGIDNQFECLNCGAAFKFSFPMKLKLFTEKGKAFAKLHKDCVKP